MTMVMSLIVLPAGASDETLSGLNMNSTLSLAKGATSGNTLTVSGTPTYGSSTAVPANAQVTYLWDSSDKTVATVSGTSTTGTIVALSAGKSNITCKVTYTWHVDDSAGAEATDMKAENTYTCALTVTDAILASDIGSITFNGRTAFNGTSVSVALLDNESIATSSQWVVAPKDTSKYATITATGSGSTLSLTSGSVTGSLPLSATKALSLSVAPRDGKISKDSSATVTASLSSSVIPSGVTPTYAWTQKESAAASTTPITGAGSSLAFSGSTYAAGTYTITCTATIGGKTATETTTIVNDGKTYDIRSTSSPATAALSTVYASSNSAASFPAINLYDVTTPAAPVAVTPAVTFTYSKVSDPSNAINLNTSNGTFTVTGNGVATLRAQTTYNGKPYTKDVVVYASALMADFDRQVWYNNPGTYYYSDLVTAASKALSASSVYGSNYYGTVSTIQSVIVNNSSLGTSTNTLSSGAQSGAISFTAYYNARGKAPVTVRLTTSKGIPVTVTLNIPVVPTPVTFDSIAAEPVTSSYNSAVTSYRVNFPSTYSTYYVIQKNGTTAPDYAAASLGTPYSASTPYTLTSADFTNGQCTLYVIATNNYTYGSSYGTYYSGAMTVTQTTYNINYNGVAGETVQFAQSDFNDFMNKVAEARGDASKAKSYPYVTFDYVTFSLPTTAQGTLYYGGTAMSTSNSSGAFNRNTKVTNLDSVTFVPNDKTTAKTITLNFTLYATRYSSSSTSRGTTVSYSGSVVVNLVREDIKYTVSQGDSVRFDESDFLSYLSSTKGYSSNYTIDYVTFDQSAVSAVNEGSLYTYYSGYNYGGSVKTTDKFYYSATASQNALSDVAFLASRYAKTGETVYIPFTIYARYGTTGTGTRQLTGTVAIKIGQTMNFIDVKTTDYFYNSVKWAVGKNITNGTSSTTFSPYKSCTRAEIVTFLWRAAGSPEPTTTRNPFRDVNAVTHSSYYKAILWASQKGITSGTSTTAFSPDQVCTRAQIVTFLYRYAGQPSGYYSNPFKDVGATSEASYYNAIRWAVGKGITSGTSATTFSPYASCNRAEAVTFLYRYTNGL